MPLVASTSLLNFTQITTSWDSGDEGSDSSSTECSSPPGTPVTSRSRQLTPGALGVMVYQSGTWTRRTVSSATNASIDRTVSIVESPGDTYVIDDTYCQGDLWLISSDQVLFQVPSTFVAHHSPVIATLVQNHATLREPPQNFMSQTIVVHLNEPDFEHSCVIQALLDMMTNKEWPTLDVGHEMAFFKLAYLACKYECGLIQKSLMYTLRCRVYDLNRRAVKVNYDTLFFIAGILNSPGIASLIIEALDLCWSEGGHPAVAEQIFNMLRHNVSEGLGPDASIEDIRDEVEGHDSFRAGPATFALAFRRAHQMERAKDRAAFFEAFLRMIRNVRYRR